MDLLSAWHAQPRQKPANCLARYVVTKHSWRGKYRRIMCITPDSVVTQNPESGMAITNTYAFSGDSDIDNISVSSGNEADGEFTMYVRQDKKSKFKPLKFSCCHRARLITDLYHCVAAAHMRGRCAVAPRLIGSPDHFPGFDWVDGQWQRATLRVTACGLELLDKDGTPTWRIDYCAMSSVAFAPLTLDALPPGTDGPMGRDAATGLVSPTVSYGLVPTPDGPFALFSRSGRAPRLLACPQREMVLTHMAAVAQQRLGLRIVADHTSGASPYTLLEAVARGERQAIGGAEEAPVAEWEVARLCPRYDAQPPLASLLEPGMQVRCRPPASLDPAQLAAAAATAAALSYSPGAHTVQRRLGVTRSWLLERNATTYDVEDRRPLGSVSALLRFAEEVGLVGVEWADGAPPSLFMAGAARDAVVAAVLDLAQSAAGRAIPVLPGFTPPGDPIIGDAAAPLACHCSVVARDPETERWCVEQLAARAREAWPHLSNSGRMFYTADIEFTTSPTPSTLAAIMQPVSPRQHQLLAPGGRQAEPGAGAGTGAVVGSPQTGAVLSGGAAPPGSTAAADSVRVATAVQEAAEAMLDAVHDFNASVPYGGVAPGTKLDEQTLSCVLALLHPDLIPGPTPLSHMPADEAKQSIAAFQALQRLVSCHPLAEAFLGLPTALSRVIAAYACGSEGVAVEAARLLTRLWAPAAARVGAAPWSGLRSAPTLALLLADPDDPLAGCDPEELSLARSAKALCFGPSMAAVRCATLMRPLRGGDGDGAVGPDGGGGAAVGAGRRLTISTSGPAAAGGGGGSGGGGGGGSTTSALLVACALEAVGAVAVEPGSRSTDNRPLAGLLQEAAALGPPLFALCHHPAPRVTQGAALLMRAVAESGAAAAAPMRQAALRYGALLHHLHAALFAPGAASLASVAVAGAPAGVGTVAVMGGGGGGAAVVSERQQLGRALVASWCDEYAPALALLRRIFPPGLVRYLNAPRAATAAPGHVGPSTTAVTATPSGGGAVGAQVPSTAPGPAGPPGMSPTQGEVAPPPLPPHGTAPEAPADAASTAMQGPPEGALVASAAGAGAGPPAGGTPAWGLKGNWEAFWDAVGRDHCHAGLIWHAGCRQELREALEREEAGLRARRQQLGGGGGGRRLGWNYEEFSVIYPSLAAHTVVGGIYVRLLLEGADTTAVSKLPHPRDLYQALHHAFLCAADPATQDPAAAAARRAAVPAHAGATGAADGGGGGSAAAAAAEAAAAADQELCARAMAAVYHVHAGVVGPVDGIPHLLRILDNSPRRPLRHALLELFVALLSPRCLTATAAAGGGGGGPAARAVRANSYALMEAGGLELLTDVVAYAHTGGAAVEGGTAAAAGAVTTAAGAWGQAAGQEGVTQVKGGLMLTSVSHDDMPREWYFYPGGVRQATAAPPADADDAAAAAEAPAAGPDALLGRKMDETGRAGPYTRDEVRQLVSRGSVEWGTLCWAAGLLRPEPLGSVRELRWMLAKGPGRFSPYGAAELALKLLQRLVALQPAVDQEEGLVLQPLPRVYRMLAGPRCLPHLCQAILTFHPPIVAAVCSLLDTLLAPNPDALARLHLTGALYFALAYPGSDLEAPARLLHRAHLAQDFAGLAGGAAAAAGLPLRQRSYLGHVLPESLLYVMETRGSEAFAEALCGDHDTPELIWTHAMRRSRLLPALSSHLGDLPLRLAQRCSGLWDYTPLPPLTYPELDGELYCHRYYLRHLADTVRFPAWPLVDHVPLLQSLLAEWRLEMSRQPLALSEADACEVLGLRPAGQGAEIGEEELRRAYRALARKYHPDKNPQGRPMFLKIQAAYERLQAGVAGGQGPQPWRILLLLRAQCVLYGRYGKDLAPYKYAGYGLLLDTLRSVTARGTTAAAAATGAATADGTTPPSSSSTGAPGATAAAAAAATAGAAALGSGFSGEALDQVMSAVQLSWLTVLSCRRNAEELARCGGMGVLAELLSRCLGVLPLDAAPTDPLAVVATSALRTLAGLAAVPEARAALAAPGADTADAASLSRDLLRCCRLRRCHGAVDAALVGVSYLAVAPELQGVLLRGGALQAVVPLVLQYDTTLPEAVRTSLTPPFSGPDDSASLPLLALAEDAPARTSTQAARALHAVLAAQALSRLAGLLPPPHATPGCPPARAAMVALLTEPLAARLSESDPRPLLALLNGTHETCRVIWNPTMREELLTFLERSHRHLPATGPHAASAPPTIGSAAAAAAAATASEAAAAAAAAAGAVGGGGDDVLSGLASFSHRSLAGELVVGGVFVRVFNSRPSELPADPPGFCKALVRYLFDALLPLPPTSLPPAAALPNLLAVLAATAALLDAEPRLLGVLASRSALSPFVACLQPAAHLTVRPRLPPPQPQPPQPAGPAADGAGGGGSVGSRGVSSSGGGGGGVGGVEGSTGLSQPAKGRQDVEAEEDGEERWLRGANQLAMAGMALLGRAAQHGGCLEAFADEHCARLLFWLLHGPPSLDCLAAALRLLRAVAGQPACVSVAALQGGWLYLTEILIHRGPWAWQQQQQQGQRGRQAQTQASRKLQDGGDPRDGDQPTQQGAGAGGDGGVGGGSGQNQQQQQQRQQQQQVASAAGAGTGTGTGSGLGPESEGSGVSRLEDAAAEDEARGEAAALLGRLMAHTTYGSMVRLSLQRLLPPGLVAAIAEGPPAAVLQALATKVETPECIWDADMSCTAATQVTVLAAELRKRQAEGHHEWTLPPGAVVQYDKLRGELFVGGAYVRLFLKNPKHPLRNPSKFADGLMERYLPELANPSRDPDLLVLLAAAMVALLRSHSLLADHLCRGGYCGKLLAQLGTLTRSLQPQIQPLPPSTTAGPDGGAATGLTSFRTLQPEVPMSREPQPPQQLPAGLAEACGSALRILHQLCESPVAAEALSTAAPPAVQVLYGAMRLGPAARVLVLEMLKRALGPTNRQRDALVLQALQYGLVSELLSSLDWQSSGRGAAASGAAAGAGAGAAGRVGGGGDDDTAVLRVLAVDVLRALVLDGIHALQVRQLLDSSPVWQAYCHQRHDLFLPSGATAQGSVVGLLTAPETARFALPPPEALGH